MPIPGLRDRTPRFTLIGSIRKGASKEDTPEGQMPKDLDYFRVEFVEGEEETAAKFAHIYGTEPQKITVLLPFDNPEDNFDVAMERHTAGAIQCVGDIEGGTCYGWRDDQGKWHNETKPCPPEPCQGCKESGRLKVIIPALCRLAYLNVITHSKHDIVELMGNMGAILELHGSLKGIPLELKRSPRKISTPGKGGKRIRREKWLLSLEADPKWVGEQFQKLRGLHVPALPEGEDEPPELEAEIVEEPETDELVEQAVAELGAVASPAEYAVLPKDFKEFCDKGVAEIMRRDGTPRFKHARHLQSWLKNPDKGNIWPFCNPDGTCAFDVAKVWVRLVQEAANDKD